MYVVAEILLPLPFEQTFSYKANEKQVQAGQLVTVSFRSRTLIGVVISTAKDNGERPLKDVESILPMILSLELLSFITRVAAYTISPRGLVFKMCLGGTNLNKKSTPLQIDHYHIPFNIQLNEAQQKAASTIMESLNKHSVIVLEGVTGSGKTEIYNYFINTLIEQSKQTLVLMPEILLATHISKRLEKRFGFEAVEWHSNLTSKQRLVNYNHIISGEAKLIIGARSSLFLPFKNLGAIVVDEEHDTSYKQEEGVIYNARDMAVLRGQLENCPVLLCSATPSVETVHNVRLGKYQHVYLPSRFGTASMPEIKIVDMKKEVMAKGMFLSPSLIETMVKSLAEGNQALLYLNRRGYAPLTMCGACGHKVECPCCSAWLVEHRHKNKLQCHYCGHSIPNITTCSNCGATDKITTYGPGVEKIVEELEVAVPNVRIALFTSDHVNTRKKAEAMIEDIAQRRVDVIVGTQMIAKGLHFPKLQFVGIIDADAGMMGGDIRGIERTYQILQQVSGRAGRAQENGLVMLQTNEPESLMIEHLLAADTAKFVELELRDRQASFSPPFSRLVMIHLSAINELHLLQNVNMMAKCAPYHDKIKVIGPAPAPIYIISNRYRYRFIIKSDKSVNVNKVIQTWLKNAALPSSIKVKVDVDPYSFL